MTKDKKDKHNGSTPENKSEREALLKEKIRSLEETVKRLEKELGEMESNWKRALADYKNLERRTLEEKEEVAKFANFVLISELISVYDSLEMLKKHTDDKGIRMIVDQFGEILQHAGLERIKALGETFDESIMEAVDTREGDENIVLEEVNFGYRFKGKIIRPAKVVVGKRK
ncbi:nucleotide exchange factor GrpE [Patescibacteria group bacterium]|nr:nucleotide exchange factor GrpE [Patescibacteria group bacterium]HOM78317.1 nucleotide exchange factor GrpE [bacterium]